MGEIVRRSTGDYDHSGKQQTKAVNPESICSATKPPPLSPLIRHHARGNRFGHPDGAARRRELVEAATRPTNEKRRRAFARGVSNFGQILRSCLARRHWNSASYRAAAGITSFGENHAYSPPYVFSGGRTRAIRA
jgi:hypothetical protein